MRLHCFSILGRPWLGAPASGLPARDVRQKIMTMKKLLIIPLIITFLGACKQEAYHQQSYSVCDIDDLPEKDYSDWVPLTDMQSSFNSRPKGTYWVHMEGRNNNGLSQFRWVQREWDKNIYSTWMHRSNMSEAEFYKVGMSLRGKGYERVSLQVFIDGSGVAKHQVLWVKSAPKNGNKEESTKETEKRAIFDLTPGIYLPSSTFQQLHKPKKSVEQGAIDESSTFKVNGISLTLNGLWEHVDKSSFGYVVRPKDGGFKKVRIHSIRFKGVSLKDALNSTSDRTKKNDDITLAVTKVKTNSGIEVMKASVAKTGGKIYLERYFCLKPEGEIICICVYSFGDQAFSKSVEKALSHSLDLTK